MVGKSELIRCNRKIWFQYATGVLNSSQTYSGYVDSRHSKVPIGVFDINRTPALRLQPVEILRLTIPFGLGKNRIKY